jgi:hypothetical protein
MQLAYFSLSEHSFLNIYLAPLIKLKSFNGFNTELSDELVKLPDSYQRMSIVSNFINNCNIMLFLMLVELLVSCCLFLVGKLLVN